MESGELAGNIRPGGDIRSDLIKQISVMEEIDAEFESVYSGSDFVEMQ